MERQDLRKAGLKVTSPRLKILEVLESSAEVEAAYGVTELPVTMLVDDQGVIQQIEEGPVSRARLSVWTR